MALKKFSDRRRKLFQHSILLCDRITIVDCGRIRHGWSRSRRGVPTAEVAESSPLRDRLNRTGYDPFQRLANLSAQSLDHGMAGFADGNHLNSSVGVKVEQVVTDPQHAPLAVHILIKRLFDAGLAQAMQKELAGNRARRLGTSLAFRICFRHAEDYNGRAGRGLRPVQAGPSPASTSQSFYTSLTEDLFPDPVFNYLADLA